jgi:acyl-CoA dehydrogenase
VHWGVQDSLHKAEQALDDLLRNFPNRFIAGAMRFVVFPFGRVHTAPSDRLDHQLAKILQVPSATRSRLGRGQYLTPSEHNPIGLLEAALADVMAAEPIHERLCKAAGKNLPFTRLDRLAERALEEGKISADEAKILVKAEESRLRSINVDDFAPDALAAAKPEKPAAQSKRQQQTEAA